MTNKKNKDLTVPGAEEIIDVAEFTSLNKKPPHGKKYRIKIDDKVLVFDNESVIGSEILTKAGFTPIECYSLYQKLKGCDFEKISSNEKVDLSKPGIERFVVKESEVYHYSLDGEPETTDLSELTPMNILEFAGIKPMSDYYLVQILEDQTQVSYKDRPNDPIKMKCPGSKFISVYRSATPVA